MTTVTPAPAPAGPDPDAARPAPPSRALRWVTVVAPLLTAAVLLFAAVASWLTARAAEKTLDVGQGQSFLRNASVAATQSDLELVLDAGRAQGLRCAARLHPIELTVLMSAGCEATDELPALAKAAHIGQPVRLESGVVRLFAPAPPPPRGPGRGPPRGPPPGGDRTGRPPPGGLLPGPRGGPGPGGGLGPEGPTPPLIYIEYEPRVSDSVSAGVAWTLGGAGGAALVLVGLAFMAARLLRREALARATEEQQRRLAALGEMSAVMAHELKNPLASLKGNAQLLYEDLEAAEYAGLKKVARVVTEATRLEKLMTDLLAFVRTERVEPAPVSPMDLVRQAVDAVDPARVDVVDEGAPATFPLDARLVGQLLGNLVRNAVQASPADARATVRVGRDGPALVVAVEDRGPGVPAAERELIFEPFKTTKVRGTGLGLAVARRVARLHGGDVAVGDAPGGGARFVVRLPGPSGGERG